MMNMEIKSTKNRASYLQSFKNRNSQDIKHKNIGNTKSKILSAFFVKMSMYYV